MSEQDRQVETRPPLDTNRAVLGANAVISSMMVICQEPDVRNVQSVNNVLEAARPLVKAIAEALPEGNERIIALNGIKGALLWVKEAIMERGPVEIVGKAPNRE